MVAPKRHSPAMTCAVCRRPLEQHEKLVDGTCVGVIYSHHLVVLAGTRPHDPVPIPTASIGTAGQVGVCDFCSAPGPSWTYPASDFVVMATNLRGTPTKEVSAGAWAACKACHNDIEADRWGDIKLRWANSPRMAAVSVDALVMAGGFLDSLHAGFKANRSGSAFNHTGGS